jgi:hypothetical protein
MVNFRGFSVKSIVALGGLVIVVGAGAYYFYVYLPETESKSAKVVQAPVKPPKLAKPPRVQSSPAASAVPAVAELPAPVAAPEQIASTPPQMPVPEQKPESVKPEPVEGKPAPKKPRVKSRPVQPTKASKPGVPAKSQQQITPPVPMVIPPVPMVIPEPVVAAAEPSIITVKYNDMLTAALRGDKDGVRQLLDLGHWVDKPGPSGLTPLMAGVMNRDTEMVQLLLENGAEPSAQALKLARKNNDAAMVLLLEQHSER